MNCWMLKWNTVIYFQLLLDCQWWLFPQGASARRFLKPAPRPRGSVVVSPSVSGTRFSRSLPPPSLFFLTTPWRCAGPGSCVRPGRHPTRWTSASPAAWPWWRTTGGTRPGRPSWATTWSPRRSPTIAWCPGSACGSCKCPRPPAPTPRRAEVRPRVWTRGRTSSASCVVTSLVASTTDSSLAKVRTLLWNISFLQIKPALG